MSELYKRLLKLKDFASINNLGSSDINNLPLDSFKLCPKCGSISLKNDSKSIICDSCDFVLYFNSSAAVAALIEYQGKVLFTIRRNEPSKGKLDLPGGFIDPGETAEYALRRELKEELNANLDRIEYIFSLPNKYLYKNIEYSTLDMFYYCSISSLEQLTASDDVAEYCLKKLTELNINNDIGLSSIQKLFGLLADFC